MRIVFLCLATAGVALAAKATEEELPPLEPLLTVDGTKLFAKQSLLLSWDMTRYLFSAGVGSIYGFLPPDVQAQVQNGYKDVLAKVDKARVENNVPAPAELYAMGWKMYNEKVVPLVDAGYTQAKNVLFPVQQIANAIVAQFEAAYPSSKGLFPQDIFDQLFVLFFLLYVVVGMVVLPLVSLFCCCGLCASRKKPVAEVRKPNGKTDLKASKKLK